jgi:hypothetical protein
MAYFNWEVALILTVLKCGFFIAEDSDWRSHWQPSKSQLA